jgi:DNA-binding phage protein
MDRKKTSKKQKFSLDDMPITKVTNREGVSRSSAKDAFMDSEKVGAALLECLIDNDTETFIEILDSYLRVNRLQVAQKANISRSTVQQALSKDGNPTLKTLAKIVHESAVRR